jgi:hypothetical protein
VFKSQTDPVAAELLDEIRSLKRDVAQLHGEREATKEELGLAKEAIALRREIETQKIERDRLKEAHEREVREVKHMVGLEKKRAEWEKEAAIREAKLEVREQAVDAKIDAFTEKLEFVQEQLTEQITYLKDDIIKEVFKRLPVVEVNKNLDFSANGANGRERAKAA